VHITPAKDPANGGDFQGMDYWSLQGYTVGSLLAEMLEVNPIRIDLPASVDNKTRYDFSIVLPKDEPPDSLRSLMRRGVEDHFHIASIYEIRLRDVYVLTASAPKLPRAAANDSAGGKSSSMGVSVLGVAGKEGPTLRAVHQIDAVSNISLPEATVDEFCQMLEDDLDRPVVNETKLDGRFDFEVLEPKVSPHELAKFDFVERLRKQLGLVIAPAQRNVETVVYRLR
jgi:uncharacterized protein (TIGR03435 family)